MERSEIVAVIKASDSRTNVAWAMRKAAGVKRVGKGRKYKGVRQCFAQRYGVEL